MNPQMVWRALGYPCLIRKTEICMWFIDNGLRYGKDWKKDGPWFSTHRAITLACPLSEPGPLTSASSLSRTPVFFPAANLPSPLGHLPSPAPLPQVSQLLCRIALEARAIHFRGSRSVTRKPHRDMKERIRPTPGKADRPSTPSLTRPSTPLLTRPSTPPQLDLQHHS
jgi:hypothetical protein